MTDDTPDLDPDAALSRIFVLADGVAAETDNAAVEQHADAICERARTAREALADDGE